MTIVRSHTAGSTSGNILTSSALPNSNGGGSACNGSVGTLSRGYKQRVAIGQALVHNPDVLILDEPTIGLDPKQIIEIRNLIRRLAADRTVILSTHILPEVTQLCDKVVIIANGRIVAEEMLESMASDDLETFFLEVTAGDASATPDGAAEDGQDAEANGGDADPIEVVGDDGEDKNGESS